MTSKIKVDNIENQCGGAVVTKCGATTTISGSVVKADDIQAADGGNLINQCGTTITLGASGDTINLASGASQTGFGRTGTVDWQTGSIKTSTFTAANGEGYFANTSGGTFTMNLPAGTAGNIVSVVDYTNTFQTNSLTIAPNGSQKIGGINANFTASTEGQSITFVYVDDTEGWKNVQDSTSNATGNPNLVATGGTITTSGDYKIHTFTGPGTFTVSNASSTAANNIVSYMVLAGGGGAGNANSGGGGAGGFREYKGPADSYTASPLNGNPGGTAVTVTAQAYPITVGAGGTGGPNTSYGQAGTNGNPSVFSTITSTAGGEGHTFGNYCVSGEPGGSGGGGGGRDGSAPTQPAGGTGNTPPVSPPQGNNGGDGRRVSTLSAGGGGGGAAGAGTPSPGNCVAGAGGTAITTSITGSPVTRAGGGGGSAGGGQLFGAGPGTGGASGGGGAGAGVSSPNNGIPGSANTGSGAGGGGAVYTGVINTGGAGGSGIVVIRYKFQ